MQLTLPVRIARSLQGLPCSTDANRCRMRIDKLAGLRQKTKLPGKTAGATTTITTTMSDASATIPSQRPRDQGVPPLLPRISAGDPAAVDACLQRYTGLVWSLASRMLGSGPDTEDVVQDIFVEIWQKADRYDPQQGSEATFIAVMARRRVIDRLRRRTTRPDHGASPLTAVNDSNHQVAATDPTFPAELADEVQRIELALGQFKPQQQQAMRLSIVDGLTHQETAERLNTPLGTVKTWVRRGLIQLRDELAQPGKEASS